MRSVGVVFLLPGIVCPKGRWVMLRFGGGVSEAVATLEMAMCEEGVLVTCAVRILTWDSF